MAENTLSLKCYQCSSASSGDCDVNTYINEKYLITCPDGHNVCQVNK